jgi:excisionase family DNA binding protein
MMTSNRQTVTIARACELVGVSRRTIYNWIADGKLQYVRTAGGAVRIFADSLWRDPEDEQPTAKPERPTAKHERPTSKHEHHRERA